jgi:hypothetical protein
LKINIDVINAYFNWRFKRKKGNVFIFLLSMVLVVDDVKTELGVLKVDDAEFAVSEAKHSWCYMGLPEGMISRFPRGKILKIED